MAKKKHRGRVGTKKLVQFCELACGRKPEHSEKILELVAAGLVSMGHAWPPGMSVRQFTGLHQDVIKARIGDSVPVPRAAKKPVLEVVKPSAPSVLSDAFLRSYAWRQVRMKVLKRDGAKCACCGATPATGAVMNVDHIKPRRHFPDLALDERNLQVLCDECNHGKGNWDDTDWRGVHSA